MLVKGRSIDGAIRITLVDKAKLVRLTKAFYFTWLAWQHESEVCVLVQPKDLCGQKIRRIALLTGYNSKAHSTLSSRLAIFLRDLFLLLVCL